MAKAIRRNVVKPDLDDERRSNGLPFGAPPIAPPAGPSRRLTGKAGRFAESLQLASQGRALCIGDRRRKSDMVELTRLVVEPEK